MKVQVMNDDRFLLIVFLLTLVEVILVQSETTWKYAKYCDPDPTYELDEAKVEQMFKNMHPNLAKLHWKEAVEMTPDRLEKICHDVLVDITPRDRDLEARYHYSKLNPATFDYTRIIRNAAVIFESDMQYTVHMTVLKCVWDELDVYLAQGDEKNVFRLDRNPDNTFEFRTGLHPVNYRV